MGRADKKTNNRFERLASAPVAEATPATGAGAKAHPLDHK